MSDAIPPPAPTPPSVESAVREYLDVIHEVRELRRTTDVLCDRQSATAIAVTSLAGDIGRMGDRQTTDSLTLVRVDRRLTALEQKTDNVLKLLLELKIHLGVVPHG